MELLVYRQYEAGPSGQLLSPFVDPRGTIRVSPNGTSSRRKTADMRRGIWTIHFGGWPGPRRNVKISLI